VSFDPRLPQGLRFFVARRHRDNRRIAEMEYAAVEFNGEVDAIIADLGGPKWVPQIPAAHSTETERIGELDVPADIAELLASEIADLGMTP